MTSKGLNVGPKRHDWVVKDPDPSLLLLCLHLYGTAGEAVLRLGLRGVVLVDQHVELQVVVMGKVLSVGAEVVVRVHVDEGGIGVRPLLEAQGHRGGEVLLGNHFPDSGDF